MMKNQIKDINEQLTIDPNKTTKRIYHEGEEDEEVVETVKGRLDIFGSKDDKEVERGFKYLMEVRTLNEELEKMKEKLSPQEKEDILKSKKLDKHKSVAV